LELDSADARDLTQGKIRILSLEVHNELAHRDRQRPVMILALGFRWTKEAEHAVRIKGRRSSTQSALC
jgi:hypothetical protein